MSSGIYQEVLVQSKPSLALAVMAALRAHPRTVSVQAAACSALANLAHDGVAPALALLARRYGVDRA